MFRTTIAVLCLCISNIFAAAPPNILIVLTDDLGYSDPGCYGSEIATPTLDRLAANGLRFSDFSNTAKCHSSRVSLLSGRWCKQAGDTSLKRSVTLPEILSPAGYFTAMTGKWHLDKQPTDFGFERYFGHLSGATHYFKGDSSYHLNGESWKVPNSGFYATTANVDFSLEFIKEARAAAKPWFLYIAFNAPHAPIQPLKQDYEKYLGRYNIGWDEIHRRRAARQQELGIVPPDTKPAPRPDHIPAWDTLTPEIRDWESRRMAGLAALIDRVDQELGRLVTDLENAGELDNTIILFLSDNGACPYDRNNRGQDKQPYEDGANWTDSTGWAWARNTPFRFYKQNQFEGGVATPAIMHWPAGLKTRPGAINRTPAHLVDVLPTMAALANAKIPDTFPNREPTALAGVSLAPVFAGRELPIRPPIHYLFESDRGLRDANWKIVSFRNGPWELYDLSTDRTELNDLAARHPERVKTMAAEWHRITVEDLRGNARETQPVSDKPHPKLHPEWSDYSGTNGNNTSGRKNRADP